MRYTLKTDQLTVQVSDVGAELISAVKDGCEYIWVGDPTYWSYHAPLVFPVCGRFYEGKYTYRGQEYAIPNHGFCRPSLFSVESQTDTDICFLLTDSEETHKVYPFAFVLRVRYHLEGSELSCSAEITNPGREVLPATFGGHPGFNVPLDGKGEFSDYYIEFSKPCSPNELIFSPSCLLEGHKRAIPLEDGRILRLRHELFGLDAIFMDRADTAVTLKSDKTDRYVTLTYPDIPYLGVWHKPRTEAPYVCIEPFCGLPGREGELEDLETRPDMMHIHPGTTQTVRFSMLFG